MWSDCLTAHQPSATSPRRPSPAAVAGYLAFPLTARSNITLNFRQDDWLIGVARAAIGVIQCCAYPVNHHPARGAARDFALQTTGACLGGRVFHAVEPLLFVGTTLGLALLCSDLGEERCGSRSRCPACCKGRQAVCARCSLRAACEHAAPLCAGVILKLVGGTCGSMLIFLFPGAMLMQHCLGERQSAAALHEALLPPPASDEPAMPTVGPVRQRKEGVQPYTMPLFWCGVLLVLVGLFVAALAVVTTLRPLPT